MENNKDKGKAGLSLAIAYFGTNGYIVSLPLNDSEKRDAIKEILKFDVDRAILNKKASEETDAPKEEEKTRRVEPAASTGGRRTAAPKYEIID